MKTWIILCGNSVMEVYREKTCADYRKACLERNNPDKEYNIQGADMRGKPEDMIICGFCGKFSDNTTRTGTVPSGQLTKNSGWNARKFLQTCPECRDRKQVKTYGK